MKKPLINKPLTDKNGDVRELTLEDFQQMIPMREADPEFVARWEKRRGRPVGRKKAVVSISLDKDILAILKESGRGWQSRLNELLRAAIGLRAQ